MSSGLPWWTGADEANRGGPPLAPPQYRLLSTFGDFIFFKGSLANVVAEGRFDRNWKVASGRGGENIGQRHGGGPVDKKIPPLGPAGE